MTSKETDTDLDTDPDLFQNNDFTYISMVETEL